jgi:hypothetical protein
MTGSLALFLTAWSGAKTLSVRQSSLIATGQNTFGSTHSWKHPGPYLEREREIYSQIH